MAELREKAAASRAKAEDSEARARRLFKARCMRRFRDIEGMEKLLLALPPERMAEVDAFLNRFIDREFADARDRGLLEQREAYAADVVYRLLTGQPANEPRPRPTAADPDTARRPDGSESEAQVPEGPGRARNANGVRPDRKVLAVIDLRALNRGSVEGDEMCEIAGVGPVSVAAIRSMLSDATLALVIKDGVDVLNVTHLGRQVTAHQRTALEARGWCERCGSTFRVEIDHNTGWSLTYDTRLEDLRLACGHCHDLKTRQGLHWEGPFGRGILVDSNGRPWCSAPPGGGGDPPGHDPGTRTGSDADDPTLFTLAD